MIENCLQDVEKIDIRICFPYRYEEGRDEGDGWVFIIVDINLLIFIGYIRVWIEMCYEWLDWIEFRIQLNYF